MGLIQPLNDFLDVLGLPTFELGDGVIFALLDDLESRSHVGEHFLAFLERLVFNVVVPVGHLHLLQPDFVVHAIVPVLPVLLLHRASLLNLVALLLRDLVGEVHALPIIHHHGLTELFTLLLPPLEPLQCHGLLVRDLLFLLLLGLLEFLLQLELFLSGLLLLLLGELGDFVGHLIPLLELARRSLDLKCQH